MREDHTDRTDITGRHGGDLAGIAQHLDYIGDMGFTAIWLNPFLENDMDRTSYHGYATTDFSMPIPATGPTKNSALVDQAHSQGMKVIMDMIFNHIGRLHWWMDDLPSADWINPEAMTSHRRTVNQDPHAVESDRTRFADGWFVPSMPDLNQRNPFLATYLIQNSLWWVEYAGLDGIRMDTYPYPDKDMMARWNRRMEQEYPWFNIVGEEWSLEPALVAYWQRGQWNLDGYDGGLPSLMDFPLQSALTRSLLAEDGWDSGWLGLYETLAADYLYPDPGNLVVFPDNHDMPRFFMQVGMDPALYRLGIAFILTTRGIPQIFYGSEIGMTHPEGDDHGFIRKDFPGGWAGDPVNGFTGAGLTPEQNELQAFFRTLLTWRKSSEAVHWGRLLHYAPDKGSYVYGRILDDERVMVVLNKGRTDLDLDCGRFEELLDGRTRGRDVISGKEYGLSATLRVPARTALVLELE
ncbi:MAG: alpha-amylase family glycosyl hydrolase [Bacteroidales bacterium]